jgi:hypothetical protein
MNTLQNNAKYKVDFIGYSAFVNQRRGGKNSKCAQVDLYERRAIKGRRVKLEKAGPTSIAQGLGRHRSR